MHYKFDRVRATQLKLTMTATGEANLILMRKTNFWNRPLSSEHRQYEAFQFQRRPEKDFRNITFFFFVVEVESSSDVSHHFERLMSLILS